MVHPDGEPNLGRAAPTAAELRASLRHKERIAAALSDVGKALGATLELDELLELILERIKDVLEADRATLYLLDDAKRELVSRLVVGEDVRSIRTKVGHGVAGIVAETGRSIRIRDAYKDSRFEPQWDLLTGYKTASMLAAPLKNHLGRTIGVIQVLNKHAGEFTAEDEEILSALTTQAAVAIDNSRLFLSLIQKNKQLLDTKEQLERRLQDLQLLFELERATSRATSLEELALAALSLVTKACRVRGAGLLMADDETGDLVQYTFDGQQSDRVLPAGVKSGEGFLGAAMRDGRLSVPERAAEDPRFTERIEGAFPFKVDAVEAQVLESERGVIGALGLFSEQGPALSEDNRHLLKLVSANVSTALRLFTANSARERGERLTAIGRLLSQMIHDFKTPLTVISGHAQLMEEENDSQKRAESVEEILKQFDLLSSMQREVLAFARGESTIFIRRVYLRKFFMDLSRQLAHEVDGRAVELEFDVDSKAVARFDEGRLARAVHNLARNAVEAMADAGGKLTISAKLKAGELVVAVADTGPGVPPEIEGRLFQTFVTAGKEGGTGLGLAIVKKTVDEHGGTISVTSSPRGARFEIRLPQGDVTPSDTAKVGTRASKPETEKSPIR